MKKISTAIAVAAGVFALSACNQSPQEQAADNIEANAENTADIIEFEHRERRGHGRSERQNAAEDVRAAGENAADEVRDGADADGNSAN